MTKQRYRLIGGQHMIGDKVFHRGDIIQSDTDYTETFKNKFIRVEESDPDWENVANPASVETEAEASGATSI